MRIASLALPNLMSAANERSQQKRKFLFRVDTGKNRNRKINTDAYRSGHNEAVWKTGWGNTHGGSTPSASAIQKPMPILGIGFCISHMRGGRNRSKRTGAQVRFCEPDEALPA